MPHRMYPPICWWCLHFRVSNRVDEEEFSCSAFSEGIPEDIFEGKFDHREHYPGDKGVVFEYAPFTVLEERFMFKVSQSPGELAKSIGVIFQKFDEYRLKGLMQPPIPYSPPRELE